MFYHKDLEGQVIKGTTNICIVKCFTKHPFGMSVCMYSDTVDQSIQWDYRNVRRHGSNYLQYHKDIPRLYEEAEAYKS